MTDSRSFFNLYSHNFVRVAAAIPQGLVADPAFNAKQTIALMREAAERKAVLVTFPELGLSAYSCEDLFHQQALLDASRDALAKVVEASAKIPVTAVVGVPLVIDSLLFNCAAVVRQGRILGLIPKTYLPNYREFYELRQFTPADHRLRDTVDLCGQRDIPFSNRLLFQAERLAQQLYQQGASLDRRRNRLAIHGEAHRLLHRTLLTLPGDAHRPASQGGVSCAVGARSRRLKCHKIRYIPPVITHSRGWLTGS